MNGLQFVLMDKDRFAAVAVDKNDVSAWLERVIGEPETARSRKGAEAAGALLRVACENITGSVSTYLVYENICFTLPSDSRVEDAVTTVSNYLAKTIGPVRTLSPMAFELEGEFSNAELVLLSKFADKTLKTASSKRHSNPAH